MVSRLVSEPPYKFNLFTPGGAQGLDILPPLLAVVFCLPCCCPGVPSLSVSLLIHSATSGCFESASYMLNLFAPGGAQGPDILPPLLAVVCCLSCCCPGVPSLSVSLLIHSVTPGCFESASASLPLAFPSRGNSTVVVHFFPQDMSNPAPSLPPHLLAYRVCTWHSQPP